MDAADLPAARYAAVLRDLARVNVVTLAARPTLAFMDEVTRRQPRRGEPIRLLDVGFGEGGMLRAIARWAEKRGVAMELVGIDRNPNSAPVARERTDPALPITYRVGDLIDLSDEPWDIVVSSLVAHHMSDAERIAFLRFMDRHARLGWFVNDLHRHRFSRATYPWLARALRVDPIVVADGRLSIARSFRPAEWHEMLGAAGVEGAQVRRVFPFRLCVAKIR